MSLNGDISTLCLFSNFAFARSNQLGIAGKYTKFHFIRIQNKAYSGEKIISNAQKIVRTSEQNVGSKCLGAV